MDLYIDFSRLQNRSVSINRLSFHNSPQQFPWFSNNLINFFHTAILLISTNVTEPSLPSIPIVLFPLIHPAIYLLLFSFSSSVTHWKHIRSTVSLTAGSRTPNFYSEINALRTLCQVPTASSGAKPALYPRLAEGPTRQGKAFAHSTVSLHLQTHFGNRGSTHWDTHRYIHPSKDSSDGAFSHARGRVKELSCRLLPVCYVQNTGRLFLKNHT